MQRIIITEVDNTSNVESLSSYDVVYVPGFSNNGASPSFDRGATLFRTPTLVTSKYDFLKLFGNGGIDDCPTFPKDQPYPIATGSQVGFPSYAIPGYIPPTEPVEVSGINGMTYEGIAEREKTITAVTYPGYYTNVDVSDVGDTKWSPVEGVIYYVADTKTVSGITTVTLSALNQSKATPVPVTTLITEGVENFASGTTTVSFTPVVPGTIRLLNDENIQVDDPSQPATASETGVITQTNFVEPYTAEDVKKIQYEYETGEIEYDYSALLVFTSPTSPAQNDWMVQVGEKWIYTDDTYIGFETVGGTDGYVKTYYSSTTQQALMFRGPSSSSAGDPDPGYRYALYLLSLGIPVYYEQMNSSFEPIDMNDPSNIGLSPVANDWFIEINGEYFRTDDEKQEPGVIYYKGADISVESMYKGLEYRFNGYGNTEGPPSDYSFDSMGDYAVKYITSGGYPTFEYGKLVEDPETGTSYGSSSLAEQMIRLASTREDALALIDHTNNPNRTIYAADRYSVVARIRDEFSNITTEVGSYGAMFTPWYYCTHSAITGGTNNAYTSEIANIMPASLAFLSALSQQLKNYNPWLAVSGVSRGPVPYCSGLHTNFTLTNNVADSYQIIPGDVENLGSSSISINPITYIRNYGYCLWGNRTLRNNSNGTKATSFLNIRNTVSDIKKRLYEASQSLLFEQNTDVLWLNFKGLIMPLLDTMVSNYILSNYNIVKYNIDPETGAAVPSYKVLAAIRIVPINSVEVFELQVQLENNEVTIAEVQ